ncbi:hypothetical protein HELRODRAFT_88699 [Helobdella robusta]|uniref:Translocon-associated protein subunit alpha n=1 Tax=Helobdella robusta TaxID=6412 RepID=T1G755_HELRO|nr:hypothetical protein HELRODRAFT_88699 [Helobdella robusta]ESN93447.1 hypothetical protein HELRODRAFT_88699 [Helobdella robusta]
MPNSDLFISILFLIYYVIYIYKYRIYRHSYEYLQYSSKFINQFSFFGQNDDDDEAEDTTLKPSPDAKTNFIFIKPLTQDLPAGQEVRVLIGFTNKGEKEFVVETIDASLRYPQDFSYYIQNFTTYRLYQPIEPSKEATFEYRFIPSDTLSSRPFGLVINVNYKDVDGAAYLDAIFNSTINIIEPDEGLDGEIFFLYIFLVAIVILAGVGFYHLATSFKKKHLGSKPKQAVELGTQNKGDVDYDWIPKEALISSELG